MEASDGETRRFGPGAIVLLEDVTGKGHVTRILAGELRCVFVQLPEYLRSPIDTFWPPC